MTIIRWQQRPAFPGWMGQFMDKDITTGFERNCGCRPATNIVEHEDHYEIQLVAPGRAKEDFGLVLENNILSVSYEKKEGTVGVSDEQYLRREYDLDAFTRSFTIPRKANADGIKARYENGILYITVPLAEKHKDKLSKQIKISD